MQGNYKGYYKRRSDDDRLNVLQKEWFHGKKCLDVGCNEGVLTVLVAEHFSPSHILGVDRDKLLIDAAKSRMKRIQYEHKIFSPGSTSTSSKTQNDLSTTAVTAKSSVSLFRPRIISLKSPVTSTSNARLSSTVGDNTSRATMLDLRGFPRNFSFEHQDAMNMEQQTSLFETIMCMSTTKWIHLYHGDEGLVRFFRRLFDLLEWNGLLVLEYQPWRSYKKRKNTNETTSAHFGDIRIFPSMFESTLVEEIGFTLVANLGPSEEEARGFDRPVLVLRKVANK